MIYILDAVVEPALWYLADWSLRWALLIGLAALVLVVFRPRRAATRQLWCLAALASGLLLPLAPRWGNGLFSGQNEVTPAPEALLPETPRESVSRLPLPLPRHIEAKEIEAKEPSSDVSLSTASDVPETAAVPAAEPWGNRRIVVAGVGTFWSIGVLMMLLRWACGAWFLRRLRCGALEVRGPAAETFSACRAELGVSSRVRLAAHAQVRSPVLLGLLRPMILLPLDWPQRPPAVQRAGLLHELAHVRRRDHWLAPLLQLVRVAFFFHPLVRWLLARLEYERELLCDEIVVHRGIDRHDYAGMLVDFAHQSGRFALPRLSGPYLPIGRRRTMKARIHHLLEENMERWIRPLPARWTVALGTCLLAVLLGVASYRVLAEEPQKTVASSDEDKPLAPTEKKTQEKETGDKQHATRTNREALRYGGKNFDQWRTDLVTELKPAIRVDGMKALAAFGANGYGPEATQAILEMMRGYDVRIADPRLGADQGDEDRSVVERAYWAITKIGPSAIPVLIEAVKEDNRNARRFAIEALIQFRTDARAAMPALLQAMKSDDVETRRRAIDAMLIDPDAKGVVPALIEALQDPDEDARLRAVQSIGNVGEKAKSAAPALKDVLRSKNPQLRLAVIGALAHIGAKKESALAAGPLLGNEDQNIRNPAYHVLQKLGADAKEAVPAASRLLRHKHGSVRQDAYSFLQSLGADAKEAVPALIAVLNNPDDPYRSYAVATLGEIGPAAKDAIPALNEMLKTEDNLRQQVRSALKKINP